MLTRTSVHWAERMVATMVVVRAVKRAVEKAVVKVASLDV
jgi:hypothetical protein